MRRRGDQLASSATALVADADAAARAELARMLAFVGYSVLQVADGDAALAAAGSEQPSLVVLDVGLPGLSAYELCRELRETHGERFPIALVSEHRLGPAAEVAGLLLGADEYFAKPVRTGLFLARIR